MEIHIKVIGVIFMLLGASHIFFPRLFHWKEDLKSLMLINKQLMEIHTFFIAFMLVLFGLLCFYSSNDLLSTSLGNQLCIGLAVFWLVRLGVQLFGFSVVLWKGKRKETSIHLLLIILWSYIASVFCICVFS